VVVRFNFADQPPEARHLWMLVEHGDAEVCKHHPGFDEDLIVETDGKTFAHWHLKHLEWADALSSGRIRVTGPSRTRPSIAHLEPARLSAPEQTRRSPGQLTASTTSLLMNARAF
jgi:hypothetical protein